MIKNIGPLPRTTPRVLKHRDTYVHMLHRLALSELVSGYPYAPDRRFARRLLDLGHEALRPVLAHTDHPHRFVRRNAVAALGKFRSPTATSKLRQLLDDKDLVVRNRALAALVAQRDQGTVDWLLSRLRTRTNASLKVLAVDGLGRIGDKRALDAILSYTQAKHRGFLQPQPDGLWAAIPALGRLGKGDKRVLALLKRLETHCRRNKRLFSKDDTPSWSPVRRDTSTRAEVTAQMCRIARARLGDDAARKALLEEIKDGAQTAAKDPRRLQLAKMSPRRRRFFAGRLGGTRGIELAGIASVNLLLACEALGQMGTKGSQLLFRVVEDSTESAPVRTQALTGLRLDSLLGFLESIEKLGALALDADKPGLLRSRALWMLEDRDTASAIRVAQKIVGDYSASTPSYEALKKDWVVIPAMQLLGRLATIDVELLTQVVARATRERTEIARLKQQQFEGRNARYVQRGRYGRTMILTIPPVLEVAMLELGRTGRPDAAVTLNRVLDETAGEARPEAAISLGGIGNRGAIEKLVGLLSDTDKFVRFNAFRALRQLTDQNHLADWLFGSQQTRAAAIKKWKDWLKQTAPQTKQ